MLINFMPKEFNFFDLFDKQVEYAVTAAKYFKELVAKGAIDDASLQKMRDIEHDADDAAHSIIANLNKTFITPFDREDIHTLAKEVDDIPDMINTIVSRLHIYKIKGVDTKLVEFAAVIEQSTVAVACAVNGMRNSKHAKKVTDCCVEINRLENVGDAMRDAALAELFENEKDPIEVIKRKEIYQDAETVLDVCEDIAHMVESILVKQA
ncbi:MAG: DUF47 family protein [Candidatus Omnitrophota bacterium]